MPLSKTFRQRARFLVIEEVKPNLWVLRVFDPRRSSGKIPIERFQARTMIDVRRVTRIFMGKHRIIRELVYHDIDEVARFFRSEKKPLPEEIESEVIASDIEDDIGDDNADDTDQGPLDVHGVGETILARPVSQAK